jgi:O-antigen chain-terminating methyltransferase
VREGDAMQALAEAEDGSLAAITAHHLIEHLPFETVTWMTREALRALAPGGVLIYETPNPRSLLVGAYTFNIDPTHRRPLPAETLTVLFDSVGYHPVEIRHLHPHERLPVFVHDKGVDGELSQMIFGEQDLAILGTRPAGR